MGNAGVNDFDLLRALRIGRYVRPAIHDWGTKRGRSAAGEDTVSTLFVLREAWYIHRFHPRCPSRWLGDVEAGCHPHKANPRMHCILGDAFTGLPVE